MLLLLCAVVLTVRYKAVFSLHWQEAAGEDLVYLFLSSRPPPDDTRSCPWLWHFRICLPSGLKHFKHPEVTSWAFPTCMCLLQRVKETFNTFAITSPHVQQIYLLTPLEVLVNIFPVGNVFLMLSFNWTSQFCKNCEFTVVNWRDTIYTLVIELRCPGIIQCHCSPINNLCIFTSKEKGLLLSNDQTVISEAEWREKVWKRLCSKWHFVCVQLCVEPLMRAHKYSCTQYVCLRLMFDRRANSLRGEVDVFEAHAHSY